MLGVAQDGQLGPVSLAAVAGMDREHLIRSLAARHAAFYSSLPDARLFGHGWLNRNAARLALALETLSTPAPAPTPALVAQGPAPTPAAHLGLFATLAQEARHALDV